MQFKIPDLKTLEIRPSRELTEEDYMHPDDEITSICNSFRLSIWGLSNNKGRRMSESASFKDLAT